MRSRRRRTSRRVAWPITRSCSSTTSRSSSPGSMPSTFRVVRRYFRKSVRLRPPPGSWCRTALARAMVWRMDVRPRPDARDAELVRAATAGDRGAFAAIYDRYADRLHDFCWSILRDRDEAADATQDAFVVAAERLGQLRDPERLRPWLYAVARSQAFRRARARSRVAPEEEMTELPDPPAVPSRPPSVRTCASWSGTPPPASPSATAPCSTSTSATASRARGWARRRGARPRLRPPQPPPRPGRALLGALLVARLGRDDCPARHHPDRLGRPLLPPPRRVARHVDTCEICAERRRTAASPLASGRRPADARPRRPGEVLERIQLTGGSGSGGDGSGSSGDPGSGVPGAGSGPSGGGPGAAGIPAQHRGEPQGRGEPRGRGTRRRWRVVALVAALLVAVATGVGLGWERAPSPTDDQGSIVAGAATSARPARRRRPSRPRPRPAPRPPRPPPWPRRPRPRWPSPRPGRPGAGGAAVALTVRNGGDEPLSWAEPHRRPGCVAPFRRPPRRGRAGPPHRVSDPRRPPRGDADHPGRAHLGRPHPNGRGRCGRASPEISDLAAAADDSSPVPAAVRQPPRCRRRSPTSRPCPR